MSGWKILGAIVALAVTAVVAVGVLMYFRVIPIPGPIVAFLVGAKEPEYSARFYPPDTIAYAWATLVPGEGQIEDMRHIWSRLNEYPGFQEFLADTKTEFFSETGIDFDDEVLPWIGPEISGAVIDFDVDQETISAAATFGVRNEDVAADFLDKWLEYMKDETDAEFERSAHGGIATWIDESAYQAYALTGDWLVYATDEDTLISILDRIAGDDGDSLDETPKFIEARAALPEKRFHSGYVDYQRALQPFDEADGLFGRAIPGVIGPATFAENAPDWVAVSGGWVERGLVLEMVSPTVASLGFDVPNLDDPAAVLPSDTLGFMAASFDPNVDNWRKALGEYELRTMLPDEAMIDAINAGLAGMTPDGGPALEPDATAADALDLGFNLANQFTGIDLENDFFAHLAGESILAVREFDFDEVFDDPTANTVEATVLLSYTEHGEEPLSNTMGEVGDLLTNFAGLTPEPVDVGANYDAEVFDLSQFSELLGGEIGYRPGYVLHDGYLTIGSTERALESTVDLQSGRGSNLASDDEFQRAITHLPADRQFLGYVAVNRIVDQLGSDGFVEAEEEYELIDGDPGSIGVRLRNRDGSQPHHHGVHTVPGVAIQTKEATAQPPLDVRPDFPTFNRRRWRAGSASRCRAGPFPSGPTG